MPLQWMIAIELRKLGNRGEAFLRKQPYGNARTEVNVYQLQIQTLLALFERRDSLAFRWQPRFMSALRIMTERGNFKIGTTIQQIAQLLRQVRPVFRATV